MNTQKRLKNLSVALTLASFLFTGCSAKPDPMTIKPTAPADLALGVGSSGYLVGTHEERAGGDSLNPTPVGQSPAVSEKIEGANEAVKASPGTT